MIRVADLIADSSLELELLSGAKGLDRPVTWTHVAEIPDAAQWLEGGELLFTTGLGIPAEADDQVSYLTSLATVNVACLGIGHRAPPLTDALLHASDRFGIPVVRVGIAVPFARIARVVAASNLDLSQSRLALQIRILESLRWWADENVEPHDVFKRLEAVTGFDIFVVDEAGAALLPGMPDAPATVCGDIPTLRTYPMIKDGFGAVVPVMGRSNAFVVLQHRNNDGATGVVVARQVATVAAVQLADLYRRQEEDLRRGSEILGSLLNGERPVGAAAAHLKNLGFDLEESLLLVALRPHEGQLINSGELQTLLRRNHAPAILHSTSEYILVLAQDTLEHLSSLVSTLEVVGGASDAFRLGADVRRCNRQAVWALRNNDEKDSVIMPYGQARTLAPWLNMTAETIGTIVEQVLGPVLLHDHAKGSELIHTLEVFLEQERSIAKAAQVLFIHPHTLRYRLDKIEHLTSKRLSSTQDVAEFWWALQARNIPA